MDDYQTFAKDLFILGNHHKHYSYVMAILIKFQYHSLFIFKMKLICPVFFNIVQQRTDNCGWKRSKHSYFDNEWHSLIDSTLLHICSIFYCENLLD